MKIEDQVVSLELAKKLKEKGFKQDGLWYHVNGRISTLSQDDFVDLSDSTLNGYGCGCCGWDESFEEFCSAPTVAEMFETLPLAMVTKYPGMNRYCVATSKVSPMMYEKVGTKLADGLSKMWLYLKEKGLI